MSMKIPSKFNKMVVYKRPSGPTPLIPLTFENIDENYSATITYSYSNAMYKKNDGEWTSTPQSIGPGDKVAISSDYYGDQSFGTRMFDWYYPDGTAPKLKVYGTLMSVYNWQDTPPVNGFNYAFDGNSSVCDASELILPPNVNDGCYVCMFESNSSLTAAPSVFPAQTLVAGDFGCYQAMFKQCYSLAVGPSVIAATSVSGTSPDHRWSCDQMFANCYNLSTGVQLLVTDIVDKECFCYMFANCSNIPWVKVHFTTWDTNSTDGENGGDYGGWLEGAGINVVNPVFYKPSNLTVPFRDIQTVPTNWTIVDF